MSKIKNPEEKKKLSYNRDYYVKGIESDKGLRKAWPKKKANANKIFRRRANQIIRKLDEDEVSVKIFKSIPRESVVKWGVCRLRDIVNRKIIAKNNRKLYQINPMLFFYKWKLYSSQEDRQPFKIFLCDLFQNKVSCSLEIAYFFDQVLYNPYSSFDDSHAQCAKTWFNSFFQDEPLLEPLLYQWVLSKLSKHKNLF